MDVRVINSDKFNRMGAAPEVLEYLTEVDSSQVVGTLDMVAAGKEGNLVAEEGILEKAAAMDRTAALLEGIVGILGTATELDKVAEADSLGIVAVGTVDMAGIQILERHTMESKNLAKLLDQE